MKLSREPLLIAFAILSSGIASIPLPVRGDDDRGDVVKQMPLRAPAIASYHLYKREKGRLDGDGFEEVPIGFEMDFLNVEEREGVSYYSVELYEVRGMADMERRMEREDFDTRSVPQWRVEGNRLEEFHFSEDRKQLLPHSTVMVFLEKVGDRVELDDGKRRIELRAKGKNINVPAFEFDGCFEYRVTKNDGKEKTESIEYWHPSVGLVKSTLHRIGEDGGRRHLKTLELYFYFHGREGEFGFLDGAVRKP